MSSVNSSLSPSSSSSSSCSSSPPCLIAETEEEEEKDDELFRLFSAFRESIESQSKQGGLQFSHGALTPCVSAYLLWIFLRCMYTRRRTDITRGCETHDRDRGGLAHPSKGKEISSLLSSLNTPMKSKQTTPASSSSSPPPLSSSVSLSSREHLRYFFDLAMGFAYSNGLLMFDQSPFSSSSSPLVTKKKKMLSEESEEEGERSKLGVVTTDEEVPPLPLPDAPHAAPFTLLPSPFPRRLFRRAERLALPFNRLVDRLTCHPKLLLFLLRDVIEADPFTRRLADICRRVYIQPAGPSSERRRKKIPRTEREKNGSKHSQNGLSLSFQRTAEVQGEEEEEEDEEKDDDTSTLFFFSSSSSSRRPPRSIQEDLRIHITRSDYMLDVSIAPKGRAADAEKEKEEEQKKKKKNGEIAPGSKRNNENAKEEEEQEKIVRFDLKQVEINTIAASFGGLSGKVTKLHRTLLRSLLTLNCRYLDERASLSSFSKTFSSIPGLNDAAVKCKTVIDEIAPVNKPIKLLAEGLALGHAMYRKRYGHYSPSLTDREKKKKNNGRKEEEEEEEERKEKEEEEEEAKERRRRRRRVAWKSSADLLVLFVCMEDERNEIDQRLLQIELMKSHGIHVFRATLSTLVSMWKTGQLAILRDDDGGTLVRHDVLSEPDTAIPTGRLVLCRPVSAPGNPSSSFSSTQTSSLEREEGEEEKKKKNNDEGMYCNGYSQEAKKEKEKCTEVSFSNGTSSYSDDVEMYSEISIIYYRTCYSPDQYVNDEVWKLREVFESSHAIKIPSIPAQLAGTKKIQEVFSDESLPLHFVPLQYITSSTSTDERKNEEEEEEDREEEKKKKLLREGHGFSRQREEKERSARGEEEEEREEEEDSRNGHSGVVRVEEEDTESKRMKKKKKRKKKRFVWLLEFLLRGVENEEKRRTAEEEEQIQEEVQSVFQLQVDPSEAFTSSSTSTSIETEEEEETEEEDDDEEKESENRRRQRAREAVESALRASSSSSSLQECEDRRDFSSSSPSSSSSSSSSPSSSSCLLPERTNGGFYILKPQREGGGNNIYGEEAEKLLKTGSPEILKQFVLMKKMNSPNVPVLFVRADPSARTDEEEEDEKKKEEEEKKDQGDLTRGGIEEESRPNRRGRRRCLRCTYSPGIQELGVFGVMVVEGTRAKEEEKERKKKKEFYGGDEEKKREVDSEWPGEMKKINNKEKERKAQIKKEEEEESEGMRDRRMDEGWNNEDYSSSRHSIEMMNRCAGWMIRTKASASHEGGVAAGFGALDSPLLLDDRLFETFLREASQLR